MGKREDVVITKGELQKAPSRVLGPFEEMERVFDDFMGRGWLRPFQRGERPLLSGASFGAPNVEVVDRPEEVVVRAEVPGVRKQDLEVSISGNMLTIKGESKLEQEERQGDYYRSEITRGAFARTIALPAEVQESKARAALKDGVLELTLPKAEESKRRSIKID